MDQRAQGPRDGRGSHHPGRLRTPPGLASRRAWGLTEEESNTGDTVKFDILNRFSGNVQFSAEIDCAEDSPISIKLGLAVKVAIKELADLQGADLQGAYLQDAYLQGAYLQDANLQDADLRGAYLQGANLQGADLQGAYLQDADLQDADLRGAYLQGAYLQGAYLQDANLQDADLRGADLDFSCWPLCCKSKYVKADDRLVSQLLFHATRVDVSGCSGGVREAVEYLRQMAVCNLFPEYRNDVEKCGEFEAD